MAYLNGKWLNRAEREEAIHTYEAIIDTMTEDLATLTEDMLVELDTYMSTLERLRRVHRSETDLLYFCWTYFSSVSNPENETNWAGFDLPTVDHAPRFHREISDIIDHISNVNRNGKVAVAAPRSHAKSSYLSKGEPLREICFRKRRYIILLSETPTVAMGNLDWISTQLKYNKKLREDFGHLLSPSQNENSLDNRNEFIAWEKKSDDTPRLLTRVESASSNQALRGRNWLGIRPDLIICDDLEDVRSNAGTKEQRQKLADWFHSTVMPLGDPKGETTAFIYMGTIVHAESLLNDVINNRADFKSVKYKAIIDEPLRMDLWEQCRTLYLDHELPKEQRKERAEAFYSEHRAEMDEGARVLWEEVQPLWRLMTWKWDNGSKAFNTEYQNTPLDEESQIFVPSKFRMFDDSDLVQRPIEYYGFWDVAMGKSSRSDYNAIVTIARDRMTGVIYVVDTWAKKCPAHEALYVALDKMLQYDHRVFAVETIGAGHDFYRQLRELARKSSVYTVKIKPISHHNAKKEQRIEALEPLCESGFLRFRTNQSLLFEQMEQFPNATHDDIPDALAGAVDLCGGTRRRRTYTAKPRGL